MNTPDAAELPPQSATASAGGDPGGGSAALPAASSNRSYALVALATIVLPILGVIGAAAYSLALGTQPLDVILLLVFYAWTICFGVELGYHRLLTHRSLKVAPWVRRIAVISGCMAAQGQPIWWTAIHRRHHMFSDRVGDPHSPNLPAPGRFAALKGMWHSHIGWMFAPETTAAYSIKYAPDLLKERAMHKIDGLYLLWVGLGLAIPAGIGGLASMSWAGALGGFLWGGLLRISLGQHALWWGIVTLCHKYGYKTFASGDQSNNNWFVAIIFFGDGWHNNHHAFPGSAKVGLRWWEIDMTWWCIRVLKSLRLAWDIRAPTPEEVARKELAQSKDTRTEQA
jgi:stearoyl-CoA desaturase (delta-9 desaturase)